jgi:coproporphyrinogen III oxidase-like Fe-S oxidoreductase
MFWHDPESIEIVKASGARMGSFGIETLDDRAGKAVGKGLGRKRIIETLEKIKQSWGNDILVQANLIAGLPYETRESIRETLEWSLSTDLLFTASWYPMWITPPSHFEIVEETEVSKISKNTDKWEVRWLAETNWINSAGLTFEECDDIAFEFIKRCNRHGLTSRATFTFVDYADLRTAGLSHQDILNVKSGIDREIVKDALIKVGKRTEQRLEKILTYKDIG